MKEFGYWREDGRGYERFPSVQDFVGRGENVPNAIIETLANAPVVASTSGYSFPCVLCGQVILETVSVRSNGSWKWLDTLPHYIRAHRVGLPTDFYENLTASRPCP